MYGFLLVFSSNIGPTLLSSATYIYEELIYMNDHNLMTLVLLMYDLL